MKQCYVHLGWVPISRIIMIFKKVKIYSTIYDAKTYLLLGKVDPKFVSKQKDKHVENLVHPPAYIWLYSVWLVFEYIFHHLNLVDSIITLCPHVFWYIIAWLLRLHAVCKFDCIQACIQDECFIYHSYVIFKETKIFHHFFHYFYLIHFLVFVQMINLNHFISNLHLKRKRGKWRKRNIYG